MQKAAATYIQPGKFAVVVVGDRKVIEAGVRALKLGPVRVLTVGGGDRIVSVTIGLERLLDYSDHERQKWRDWFAADPARLSIALQPGGRFPTAAELLDHIFLVERRHLCRLQGATPPESTGVPAGDWQRCSSTPIWCAPTSARYVVRPRRRRAPTGRSSWNAIGLGPVTMSRRRLLTHVFLHEVRHLAQLALAARMAGIEPPGKHDLFLFEGFDLESELLEDARSRGSSAPCPTRSAVRSSRCRRPPAAPARTRARFRG